MYLMKAKKHVEKLDKKDFDEKRERQIEREKTSDQQSNRSPSKRNEDGKTDEFKPDELPDGACFRPRVVLGKDSEDSDTAIRAAEVRPHVFNTLLLKENFICPKTVENVN